MNAATGTQPSAKSVLDRRLRLRGGGGSDWKVWREEGEAEEEASLGGGFGGVMVVPVVPGEVLTLLVLALLDEKRQASQQGAGATVARRTAIDLSIVP